MLTKLQPKVFFLGGTAVFFGIFLVLSIDTHLKVPDQTNEKNLTPAVIAGKHIWEQNNCMGCHTLFGEGAYYAPELTKVVERRGKDWIKIFIKNPEAMFPGQRKMVKYPKLLGAFQLFEYVKWRRAPTDVLFRRHTADFMPRRQRQSKQDLVFGQLGKVQLLADRQRVEPILGQFVVRQILAKRPQEEHGTKPKLVRDCLETALAIHRSGTLDCQVQNRACGLRLPLPALPRETARLREPFPPASADREARVRHACFRQSAQTPKDQPAKIVAT